MKKHEPLFVCEYCESDQNCHPALELNVWHVDGKDEGELICDECLCDKTKKEKEAGKPVQFAPEYESELAKAQTEIERLSCVLAFAREDKREAVEKAETAEAERWAERLNWLHTKHGADCSGTDSADLLDCVEDEIKQVINTKGGAVDQQKDENAELSRINTMLLETLIKADARIYFYCSQHDKCNDELLAEMEKVINKAKGGK